MNNKVQLPENSNSGIYKIVCTKNNKVYIGSSANLLKRFQTHIRHLVSGKHRNPHLQSAFTLYGIDYFEIEILEFCSVEQLIIKEQYWMDFYKSYEREFGFNNTIASDSPLGYKHTDDAKHRMSEIKKQQLAEGTIKSNLIGKGWKGRHTQETKDKLSRDRLGSKNPMWGRKESEDHKKQRMKNCLAVQRWNKGLTKNDDPRLEKLAVWKGKIPPNALKCILTDINTKETWTADSLKHLSEICPISLASLARLKSKTAGTVLQNKYKIEIL